MLTINVEEDPNFNGVKSDNFDLDDMEENPMDIDYFQVKILQILSKFLFALKKPFFVLGKKINVF